MGVSMRYIRMAQGFGESRITQYKFKEELGSSPVGKRILVKHRLSDKLYELKSVAKASNNINESIFKNEVSTLQRMSSNKRVVSMIDYFEDKDGYYILLKVYKQGTLRDFLAKYSTPGKPRCEPSRAALYIYQVASALKHLHHKNIAHRSLSIDSIAIKCKHERLTLYLSGFDFSLGLQKGNFVTQ